MQAESLQVLESASVAPAQARAIVRAIEIEIAGASGTLATKHDVLALHHALDVLRAEFRAEMTALAAQLRAEMADLATKLRAELAGFATKHELEKAVADLRKEIADVRNEIADVRKEIADVRKEIADLRKEVAGVARQMYVALLGQMTVMLGFFYFFLTQFR